jgi:hypothetical protein
MKKKDEHEPVKSELILSRTEDGETKVEVRLQDEKIWLTQKLMTELFQKDIRIINKHIKNIVAEGELALQRVVRNFRIIPADGEKRAGKCLETPPS